MTHAELMSVLAVLLSPLVALQVSEFVHLRRERRQRRMQVFRTLMSTRASGLAPEHVQALNMIDIEFHGSDSKSKAVLTAWKAYLDHLNNAQNESSVWGSKREDLFVELLFEMARHLGYDFDKTHIRRTSYFPKGFGDLELDQHAIRKGLAGILSGHASFPIYLSGVNQSGEESTTQSVSTSATSKSDGDPGRLLK
jgi:hypothetical protein